MINKCFLLPALADVSSLFVDSHSHDGFHHTAELSHVLEAVPFKGISPLWSHNRGNKQQVDGVSLFCGF